MGFLGRSNARLTLAVNSPTPAAGPLGGIGRRKGLKIPRPLAVPVRSRQGAPEISLSDCNIGILCGVVIPIHLPIHLLTSVEC